MGTIQSVAGDFLTRILRDKQAEIAARQTQEPQARLAARAVAAPSPRPARLRADHLCVLAEVKRGSPSAGTFDASLDAPAQARRYARGGAAVISVLTDAPYF